MDHNFNDKFGEPPPLIAFNVSAEVVLVCQVVVCTLLLVMIQPPFVVDVAPDGYVSLSAYKTLAVVGLATMATAMLHHFNVSPKDAFVQLAVSAHRNMS